MAYNSTQTNGSAANGIPSHHPRSEKAAALGRAQEVEQLLVLLQKELLPFIASADTAAPGKLIIEPLPPKELHAAFDLDLPRGAGRGQDGLLSLVKKVLRYSVNTWSPGFMDKLYASTDPVGVCSELVLAVLNTNVHVYQVSPALTIIEKATTRRLANLLGFTGPNAGGMTLPGGSASNSTSLVIARNALYPATKTTGNGAHRFVVFTSEHGHYSVEKATILCGFGSDAVWTIPVDKQGRMVVSELEAEIKRAKDAGFTPLYVNVGAGTTVLGSFDPFPEIAAVCRIYGLWMHVDGSWGGSVVFSENQKWRLKGAEYADSMTVNPHKMLGVPMTCSFLVGPDRRRFWEATQGKAGYLFHEDSTGGEDEIYDLAQMTMGCGRRGDSLKLAFGWVYYGKDGYQARIDHAFGMAAYFAEMLMRKTNFHLVSENPPPCLQVCFYYTPEGVLFDNVKKNTSTTRAIAAKLVAKGFMIDYSPDPVYGEFFRAVVNSRTTKETIDALVGAIEEHLVILN